MTKPLVTIAVPSLNQGAYLDICLQSIFAQNLPIEVIVVDGGSSDDSVDIIHQWESRLTWWRSNPDRGQAAAINEAIARGTAPYVCWLNSDDVFLPGGLLALLKTFAGKATHPAAYGQCWTISPQGKKLAKYLTVPFSPWLLARFCFIAQPATLVRRVTWEAIGGLNEELQMAMDYDLWWRLFHHGGSLHYIRTAVAGTRLHNQTKTATRRADHYRESMAVVRNHYGSIPLKWYLAWPFMVSLRGLRII